MSFLPSIVNTMPGNPAPDPISIIRSLLFSLGSNFNICAESNICLTQILSLVLFPIRFTFF